MTVTATFKHKPPGAVELAKLGAAGPNYRGRRVTVSTSEPMDLTRGLLDRYGDELRSISVEEASLEEVFLNLTGRGLRE